MKLELAVETLWFIGEMIDDLDRKVATCQQLLIAFPDEDAKLGNPPRSLSDLTWMVVDCETIAGWAEEAIFKLVFTSNLTPGEAKAEVDRLAELMEYLSKVESLLSLTKKER